MGCLDIGLGIDNDRIDSLINKPLYLPALGGIGSLVYWVWYPVLVYVGCLDIGLGIDIDRRDSLINKPLYIPALSGIGSLVYWVMSRDLGEITRIHDIPQVKLEILA